LIHEIFRLRDVGIQVTDRALEQAHLTSSLVLWFLSLPESDRDHLAKAACAIYSRHLASEEPLSITPIGPMCGGNEGRVRPEGVTPTGLVRNGQKRKPKSTNSATADTSAPCLAL
jgi:hypothetical protein